MTNLATTLNNFTPISLEEMDRVKLQNRTDTKYIFNFDYLAVLLDDIKDKYSILEINNKRTNSYKTLYYDTPDFKSYIHHHNGKLNRTKFRFRNYVDSGITFLEVKFKNNKERTIKSRIPVKEIETKLSKDSIVFIKENTNINPEELIPTLWNSFTRLTLVHKIDNERLTIDFNLKFNLFNSTEEKEIPHLVIAEVKQEKATVESDFIKAIKKYHIRQSGMSKYCVGTALLNKNIKSNNFKERILKIKKLKNVRRVTA